MVKKYRLIPERDYEMWIKSGEKSLTKPENTILDSKLPDDVKIKLFQDQKRIECNERDKADLMLKMGAFLPPKIIKDAEVQYELNDNNNMMDFACGTDSDEKDLSGTANIPVPPPLPITPVVMSSSSSRKRKDPPVDSTKTSGFQKNNMKKIARFLAECGINGNAQGQVLNKNKLVEDADYVTLIRQLTDARVKRSESTMKIINELQKFNVPQGVFSASIMNLISNKSMNVSDAQNSSVKWDAFK